MERRQLRLVGTEPDAYQLVRRAQQGDRRAFDELLDHCGRRIMTAIGKELGTHRWRHGDLADEAMSATALKIVRSLPNFRSESAPCSWMYVIAQNATRDLLRAARRRNEIPLEPEWDSETDSSFEEASMAKHLLAELFDRLEPDDVELLRYRYGKELTYRQIADRQGVRSEDTVRDRVRRAERRARKLLRELER